MDPISNFGRCRLKTRPERSSQTLVGGEVGYHGYGAVEAQGSLGLRVDMINDVQKRGIQHHQGEDNARSIEGVVEYV